MRLRRGGERQRGEDAEAALGDQAPAAAAARARRRDSAQHLDARALGDERHQDAKTTNGISMTIRLAR